MITEEEKKFQMVVKSGQTYWVAVPQGSVIMSFHKWKWGFRVCMDVYSRANPERLAELIQYMHVMNTINTWVSSENVSP